MEIRIIKEPISRQELTEIAKAGFGEMVKAVVDVEQGIMAIGGELHADEEAVLASQYNSKRPNTWGINLYPSKTGDAWIEFDSMVNIKPIESNRSRGVENKDIQLKIKDIVSKLIS